MPYIKNLIDKAKASLVIEGINFKRYNFAYEHAV
jgi:hypothetical protein